VPNFLNFIQMAESSKQAKLSFKEATPSKKRTHSQANPKSPVVRTRAKKSDEWQTNQEEDKLPEL
jgi:hypothetical protein